MERMPKRQADLKEFVQSEVLITRQRSDLIIAPQHRPCVQIWGTQKETLTSTALPLAPQLLLGDRTSAVLGCWLRGEHVSRGAEAAM